jgi:hypothetical protein
MRRNQYGFTREGVEAAVWGVEHMKLHPSEVMKINYICKLDNIAGCIVTDANISSHSPVTAAVCCAIFYGIN